MVAWEDQHERDCGWGIFGAFFDDPGPVMLLLTPARYTTSTGAWDEVLGVYKYT